MDLGSVLQLKNKIANAFKKEHSDKTYYSNAINDNSKNRLVITNNLQMKQKVSRKNTTIFSNNFPDNKIRKVESIRMSLIKKVPKKYSCCTLNLSSSNSLYDDFNIFDINKNTKYDNDDKISKGLVNLKQNLLIQRASILKSKKPENYRRESYLKPFNIFSKAKVSENNHPVKLPKTINKGTLTINSTNANLVSKITPFTKYIKLSQDKQKLIKYKKDINHSQHLSLSIQTINKPKIIPYNVKLAHSKVNSDIPVNIMSKLNFYNIINNANQMEISNKFTITSIDNNRSNKSHNKHLSL